MNKRFKILSLDGGGVRGYLSIKILENAEKHLNNKDRKNIPIGLRFDLIAGTSTGAIIASLLAKGLSAKEVSEIYESSMKKVFKKRNLFTRYFQSTYSSEELEKIVLNEFTESNVKLTLDNLERDLLITSFDLNTFQPKVFKSKYSVKNNIDYYVSDVIMASTAAPSFFPAYCKIETEKNGIFIDGGVIANNPSLIALIDSQHFNRISKEGTLAPESLKSISLLSIGTGKYIQPLDLRALKNGFKLDWAINFLKGISPIKEVLFSSQEALEESKVRLLSEVEGVLYKRINPILKEEVKLDDVDKMNSLDKYTSIEEHIQDLEKIIIEDEK